MRSYSLQSTKREDHRLVTDGVYAWFRPPSYVGWLYWSVGTQLILCNPVNHSSNRLRESLLVD